MIEPKRVVDDYDHWVEHLRIASYIMAHEPDPVLRQTAFLRFIDTIENGGIGRYNADHKQKLEEASK